MIPLADNPAVTDPHRALTPTQRDCLSAIAFFRFQSRDRRGWRIGNKRFSATTVDRLAEYGLVSRGPRSITTTVAGELAVDKLKGNRPW